MAASPSDPSVRRSNRPTISDVAHRAGVDRAVVSKVLSDDPSLRVREETRERVRKAAAELGYLPNFHARRAWPGRRPARWGCWSRDGNPLFAEIMAGAEEAADERGLLLSTATHQGDLPDHYRRLLRGGIVDALLVSGLRAEVDTAELFRETQVPVILVNRRSRGSDRWVILDDERAARMATEHVIRMGHRRIAFFGGPPSVDTAERRLRGFRIRDGGRWADRGRIVAGQRRLLRPRVANPRLAELLMRPPLPTAIVAADAPLGLGAWHALAGRGITVPQRDLHHRHPQAAPRGVPGSGADVHRAAAPGGSAGARRSWSWIPRRTRPSTS